MERAASSPSLQTWGSRSVVVAMRRPESHASWSPSSRHGSRAPLKKLWARARRFGAVDDSPMTIESAQQLVLVSVDGAVGLARPASVIGRHHDVEAILKREHP